MTTINHCEKCGGVRSVTHNSDYQVVWQKPYSLPTIVVNAVYDDDHTIAVVPCSCICDTAMKHDGALGDATRAHFDDNFVDPANLSECATYKGIRVSCPYGYLPLTPKQALSLRDWLIQESPELQRLAKEQADASQRDEP